MTTSELIELAGQRLADAAQSPARVILFGSQARGDARVDSDFDFLVIEREVDDSAGESARLYDSLADLRVPADIIVLDQQLAERRAKVLGTMVSHALREGRVVAQS